MTMPVRSELTQHRGTVHGGVIGAVADNVSGWAAASLIGPVVTSNFTVHFLRPWRGGEDRSSGASDFDPGRRLAVVDAKVFMAGADDLVLVATAAVLFLTIEAERRSS